MSHPTKAMLAGKSALIGIFIPSIDELSDISLLRQASAIPSVYGARHKPVINRRIRRSGQRQGSWVAAFRRDANLRQSETY
jgi:hypothetical protein